LVLAPEVDGVLGADVLPGVVEELPELEPQPPIARAIATTPVTAYTEIVPFLIVIFTFDRVGSLSNTKEIPLRIKPWAISTRPPRAS
jgi:hypothetical protein